MLQLITPQGLRGRVMGLYAMAFTGVTPFGSLLVGTLAEHVGVRGLRDRGEPAGLRRGGTRARWDPASSVIGAGRAGSGTRGWHSLSINYSSAPDPAAAEKYRKTIDEKTYHATWRPPTGSGCTTGSVWACR
jgi:hypothetical protein